MRVDRLAVLRDYLATSVADKQFNLGQWICGTVACAFGHACSIPEFQAEGLHVRAAFSGVNERYQFPAYQETTCFKAAMLFFNLTFEQARSLFSPTSYAKDAGRADVIKNMTAFIEASSAQA